MLANWAEGPLVLPNPTRIPFRIGVIPALRRSWLIMILFLLAGTFNQLRATGSDDRTVTATPINGTHYPCTFRDRLINFHQHRIERAQTPLAKAGRVPFTSEDSVRSARGYFMLHFDRTGPHAVPAIDAAGDGIPDYIDSAAVIFDNVWNILINQMQYPSPINPDGKPLIPYPVYFRDLNFLYGYTESDQEILVSKVFFRYSAYTVMENDYAEALFNTQDLQALKVTAAHEFFHAIHLAYGIRWKDEEPEDMYLMEMSSTWIEDVIYEDINRYLEYLPFLFRNFSNLPLTTGDYLAPYGNSLFLHMLEKKFGAGIVRQIWDEIPHFPGTVALALALARQGSSLTNELHDYGRWMNFTGIAARGDLYFPEAEVYPQLQAVQLPASRLTAGIDLDLPVNPLSTTVLELENPQPGNYLAEWHSTLPMTGASLIIDGKPAYLPSDSKRSIEISPHQKIRLLLTNAFTDTSHVKFQMYPETNLTGNPVLVYPNPLRLAEQKRMFFTNLPEQSSVHILNADGIQLQRLQALPGSNTAVWELGSVRPGTIGSGVYLYVIKGEAFEQTGKFSIIR